MRKNYFIACLVTFLTFFSVYSQTNQLKIFDKIVFYNGYAATSTLPTPAGVERLANAKYAKKVEATDLAQILNTLTLNVTINALCDNYDRIGGAFLTFVPTGDPITSANKKTIEIGRFITPFMNKNVMPDQVGYTFDLNHLVGVFKDPTFLQNNDIWVEFFLFGVPTAAQTQVAGCAGREDVFEGTLVFESTSGTNPTMTFTPKPLWNKIEINKTTKTDVWGTAARVVFFNNSAQLNNAYVHLITSAHGAGQGGEEYVRRDHKVYFDNNLLLTYKPGGLSCEPFRQYNTQPNGIYGTSPKTASWWAGWNNWCPGDKIPNRLIALGNVAPGDHSLKVDVPNGMFPNSDDKIVMSAFIYSDDNVALDNKDFEIVDYSIFPNPTTDIINVEASSPIKEITVYNLNGKKLLNAQATNINIGSLANQTYMLHITLENGKTLVEKIVKK